MLGKTVVRLIASSWLAVLALTGTAMAADPAIDGAYYDWSGPYLGATGSYSFGSVNGDTGCCADSFDIGGIQLGGIAGYNYAIGEIVAGLEADFGTLDVDGVGFGGGVDDFDVAAIGRLRSRLGLPVGNLLMFLAAGLSIGNASADVAGSGSQSQWHLGWNAGAGLDYAMTEHFILRAEFIYDAMSAEDYRYASNNISFDWDASTFRLGALVKF